MGKILVVDDESDVCQLMVKLLKRLGHQAACATSGPEALASVRGERPDLILLDVMMPEMSGIEVLRRLRASKGNGPNVPVIIFSALSDPQIRKEALDLGASDYWVKASMDLQDIMKRLSAYLPPGPPGAGSDA
jgi:two-component system response regulator AtoC